MNEVLHAPDIAQQLARLGMQPGSPADMAAFVAEETRRWGEVIRPRTFRRIKSGRNSLDLRGYSID